MKSAFHSGFEACAKEVLQYLSTVEKWTSREQRCTQLIEHLHKALAQLAQSPSGSQERDSNANCVPVIQRTQNPEANENDTDTDSGYGGEAEKSNTRAEKVTGVKIKREFADEHVTKKPKLNWNDGTDVGGAEPSNLALMNSLIGMASMGQQTPFCVPFYFINPSAAASYMPFVDKSSLEKLVYPALTSPFPWIYPGIPAQTPSSASAVFSTCATEKNNGFRALKEKDGAFSTNGAEQTDESSLTSEDNSENDHPWDQSQRMQDSDT